MNERDDTSRNEQVRGPMAFLADLHGNLEALDAVLRALKEAGAGAIYVAGDLVFQGDQPLEVWQRLQEVGARCVRGTTDLALATLDPERLQPRTEAERAARERFLWTRRALGELIVARLGKLPEALRLQLPGDTELLVVHGAPTDPDQPLTHDLTDEELAALLGDDTADVVCCGASHVPFEREVRGVRVVGLGSVGAAPEGRVAHYTLVRPTPEGLRITQHGVAY